MTEELDLLYLRDHLSKVKLIPYKWEQEDKNILAFTSSDKLVDWYSQLPGIDGEPYRDRGFYTRELAMVSRIVQPSTIVEFGTSLGIGTCLLHWLNPSANIITVDIEDKTYMPGNKLVPIGHLAKYQKVRCTYIHGRSWGYVHPQVDLCFIDGDHSYESVLKDSMRAWLNRNQIKWCIVWHDYNKRHPGVIDAVNMFCNYRHLKLRYREDSDTVWISNVEENINDTTT